MSNRNDKNKLNSGEVLPCNDGDNPEPSNQVYMMRNKSKQEQTASPDKYPQGYFKDKACRKCTVLFSPTSPSELYCGDVCKDEALVDNYLLRTYNIDMNMYRELLTLQNNVCGLCRQPGWTMAKHHKLKLVVDHDHATGKVRGLLCHNCNRALGLLQDNPEVIRRRADWVEGATTIQKWSTPK
jgi:hypothetical protein